MTIKECNQLAEKANFNGNYWREFIDKAKELTPDDLRQNVDLIRWSDYSVGNILNEELIRQFADYVDWTNISTFDRLSLDFIRQMKDRVNWRNVSAYQSLTQKFIEEFKDEVNWEQVSFHQHHSIDWCQKHAQKIQSALHLK